jgi:hypothetical protein
VRKRSGLDRRAEKALKDIIWIKLLKDLTSSRQTLIFRKHHKDLQRSEKSYGRINIAAYSWIRRETKFFLEFVKWKRWKYLKIEYWNKRKRS